ncbi:MAG: sulfurtransferase [Acidimicrobiaceae bacterium]|nr:sulfurtransferase [Acidimicrobiaceae bacterium]
MALLPPLVDAETLAQHLGDPALRIVDATVHLRREVPGGPYRVESGRAGYEAGHLPGAAFADLAGDLADPASPYPFTLPDAARFEAAASALGIGPGTHVVAYAQEAPMWATRLWWLLGYFGFDDVSVLDGGLEAWRAKGREMVTTPSAYPPAVFQAHPRPERLVRRSDVEAVVAGGGATLVNALTRQAFSGIGPFAYSRPGRIPGSVSLPSAELLDDAGRFRAGPELLQRADAAGADGSQPIIAYCGGGISATVDLFALRLIGRDGRLYDGSLTEWSADPSLPLETD